MGHFKQFIEESSTREYVDNILPKALKKIGASAKVQKKTGFTKYSIEQWDIINDGVGIIVKFDGKEHSYFSKPKLDYKKAVELVQDYLD